MGGEGGLRQPFLHLSSPFDVWHIVPGHTCDLKVFGCRKQQADNTNAPPHDVPRSIPYNNHSSRDLCRGTCVS